MISTFRKVVEWVRGEGKWLELRVVDSAGAAVALEESASAKLCLSTSGADEGSNIILSKESAVETSDFDIDAASGVVRVFISGEESTEFPVGTELLGCLWVSWNDSGKTVRVCPERFSMLVKEGVGE